ncbi:MAG: hypothetical protein ACRDZO_26135 [Egibacteraceae bacterium]
MVRTSVRGQAMTVACLVIRPDYRNGSRGPLPLLASGVDQLATLLQDHDVTVTRLPTDRAIHRAAGDRGDRRRGGAAGVHRRSRGGPAGR